LTRSLPTGIHTQVPRGGGAATAVLRGVQAGDQAEAPPAGQVVPGLVCKRLARAQARPPSSPPPLQRQGVQFCNGESNASYRIMAGSGLFYYLGEAILVQVPSPSKE